MTKNQIKLADLKLNDRQLLEKIGHEALFKAKKQKTILKSKQQKLDIVN
jgi:hypothetical protein